MYILNLYFQGCADERNGHIGKEINVLLPISLDDSTFQDTYIDSVIIKLPYHDFKLIKS